MACVEAELIVELDGGQHAEQAVCDAKRTGTLPLHGWKVVRFWNNEVIANLGGIADTILYELNPRAP